MATYTTECVAGHNYKFAVGVFDASDVTGRVAKINPSIDPNDFLLSVNDGPWEAFDVAPVVSPAGSERIVMQLSAAKTSAAGADGVITVRIADASDSDGWIGGIFDIPVTAAKATTVTDTAGLATALATIAGYIDTEVTTINAAVAAIQIKTDALPADTTATLTTLQTKLRKYVQLIARKDAGIAADNAAELGELNANGGSGAGTFSNQTDGVEALRDRGDGAWITATGFATPADVTDAQTAITDSTDALADTLAALGVLVDAIAGKTGNLPPDPAGASDMAESIVAAQAVITTAIGELEDLTAEEVWSYVQRTLTSFGTLTALVATVNAGFIPVFARDTWAFTLENSALALAEYEKIAFVVKDDEGQDDDDAILYVRTDVGLVRIGGSAATPGDGSLVTTNTSFTVKVAIAVTGVRTGQYRWWLKGFKATPTPDEGYTIAAGVFKVNPAGVKAIS